MTMAGPKPKHLDPDTAPQAQSIWIDIDRKALESQTQALFGKQHVAGRRFYAGLSAVDQNSPYHFSFEIERSLADDFAFIAASQPEVRFVSAAAIEQCKGGSSFVLRLAVNEGVSPDVRRDFDKLFGVLRGHAKKGKSSSGVESVSV